MSTETKAELDGRSLLATLADLIAADDPAAAIASIARQAALLTRSSLAVATYQAHEEAAPEVAVFAAPGVDDVPARLLGPALHAALRDAGRSVRWPSPSGSPLDAILDAANVGDSVLAAPLGGSTAGAGSVAVVRHATSSFAEADESLLLAFAATASAALERTQLVADLEAARAQREAFFGVLSHELRTPMTTIYGGTRVLRQSGTRLSHDARQQLLDDVGEEAERLYRLVEDLLVLSRTERNALPVVAEPMLVQHVLARVVASEQQRWPRARFRLVPDVGLPPVMGDSTLVEQAIRNLLSNAAKYAGDAGPIEIRATATEDDVVVTVLDEGPGIDADNPDQVFELFYRAPEAAARAQGAGIGLYACRELIRAMGGDVWVRPRNPGGAEFGFRLPRQPIDDVDGASWAE